MLYEVIDNYLHEKDFYHIKNYILGNEFKWTLTHSVTRDSENLPITSSYYFTHTLYHNFNVDKNASILAPLLEKMECKSLMRIKANLYPSTDKITHHEDHFDYDFQHRGAIFYLNTNNGLTVIGNEEIKSVENRILFFDPSILHHSTTCTDSQYRVNINFNFF